MKLILVLLLIFGSIACVEECYCKLEVCNETCSIVELRWNVNGFNPVCKAPKFEGEFWVEWNYDNRMFCVKQPCRMNVLNFGKLD